MIKLLVPDTLDYMIAGYIVVGVMVFGYILSLILRWRKAKLEYLSLEIKQD
ncbi:MAG: hypothetical protein WBB69_08665 [Anaerolineales bacterium]